MRSYTHSIKITITKLQHYVHVDYTGISTLL